MLEYKSGDIFDEDVEALVNSVNCVGVMGRGLALQFKSAFPDNYKAYRAACKRGEVRPGEMFIFERPGLNNPRYIVNFPTKRHWRSKSNIRDVVAGLEALAQEIRAREIRSIALPALASDLGGLDWQQVRPEIETALGGLDDVRIVVFEPGSVPADGRPNRSTAAPSMTAARAVLISLIDRHLRAGLDPMITLLEVHKLMYFMQHAREPLKLDFVKESHGPYATNLRHLMRRLEHHYLTGYRDGGDDPYKQIDLVPGAIEDAERFLADHPVTRERFERVGQLVDGFESPTGLELLATVHWVMNEHPDAGPDEIVDRTYMWGRHKRRFTRRQIQIAVDRLKEQGWAGEAGTGYALNL